MPALGDGRVDFRDIEHWWGNPRRKVAHWFSSTNTDDAACGRVISIEGGDTRFDPKTGEPWPKCKRCVAALRVGEDGGG